MMNRSLTIAILHIDLCMIIRITFINDKIVGNFINELDQRTHGAYCEKSGYNILIEWYCMYLLYIIFILHDGSYVGYNLLYI